MGAQGLAPELLDNRNELYVVPMADGRYIWRIKRAAPRQFSQLLGSRRLRKMLGLQ